MLGDVLGRLGESRGAHEVFEPRARDGARAGRSPPRGGGAEQPPADWIAEKDVARAAADLETQLEIGRGLGMVVVELVERVQPRRAAVPGRRRGGRAAARGARGGAGGAADRHHAAPARPAARAAPARVRGAVARRRRRSAPRSPSCTRPRRPRGAPTSELLPSEELLLDAILLASSGGERRGVGRGAGALEALLRGAAGDRGGGAAGARRAARGRSRRGAPARSRRRSRWRARSRTSWSRGCATSSRGSTRTPRREPGPRAPLARG